MVKVDYVEDGREAHALIVSTFDKNAEVFDPPPGLFHFFGKRLIELAAIPAGAKLLDLGVGKGNVLFECLPKLGPTGHATGIDFSEEMVLRLERIAKERGHANVAAKVMNSTKTDFPDHCFDVVVAGSAVCFVPDLDAQLREIRRILRPGGTVAIWEVVEPTFDWLFMNLWIVSQSIPAERARALHAAAKPTPPLQKPETYPAAFERAGFVDLRNVRTEHAFPYEDEAHYWRWLESTVAPWYYSWLDEEYLAKFRSMVSEVFAGFREEDGRYHVPSASRSFIARSPGP